MLTLNRQTVRRLILGSLPALFILAGCEKDEVTFPTRQGPFTSSNYAAIGNSLTAGFMNGGLEIRGQQTGFAGLVAQAVLGDELQLPLVDAPGLGSEPGMTPLFVSETGDVEREPLTVGTTDLLLNSTYPLPYDNLGVPGATTRQMLDAVSGTIEGNPFFDLVLRNDPRIALGLSPLGSQMTQLEKLQPQLITAWTGNNEVLGGALSGTPQSTDPFAEGYVVPPAVFEADFIEFCQRLEAIGADMVAVANVPPVAAIPYTTFFGTGSIPGVNRWVMEEDLDGDSDNVQLVLLPAPIGDCVQCYLPFVCQNASSCDTIPAEFTLTVSEVQLITDAVAAYNQVIAREVAARGWALVDIHTKFLEISNIPTAGPLNRAFPWQVNPITGQGTQNVNSAFTLDGVHPSEKGHARVANEFLTALNNTYGTSYADLDEGSVQNISGFERLGAGAVVQRRPVSPQVATAPLAPFSEDGREALKDLRKLFQARY